MKLRGGSDGLVGRTKDAAVGDLERPVRWLIRDHGSDRGRIETYFRTFKVPYPLVAAVVSSPPDVVPLDAEPDAARAGDLANVADGAGRLVKRQALA